MTDEAGREPARDPQDLEQLLVSRERAGDVEGMGALYEPYAVLDCGDGRLMQGREAIQAFYAGLVAMGRKFDFGDQPGHTYLAPVVLQRTPPVTRAAPIRISRS